ncbi:MAG: TRAP transporter large permease [Geminicoccaceae bacterium]
MTGLLMFPALIGAIMAGFPVGLSLMAVAFVFALIRFGDVAIFQLMLKVMDTAESHVLAAVPLFIFMGAMFQRAGIAEQLFEAIHMWTRRLPGGVAISTVILCVVFAAASGVIGATESVVGLLAIPAMLRFAYDKGLISGTICAGGSLGTIIPPSIVAVVLGPVADVSVGDIFLGMFIPGLMLAGVYIAYIVLRCLIRPQDGPRVTGKVANDPPFLSKILFTLGALVPPVVIITATLGSIAAGIATPTEAAAVGALGSLFLTAAHGRLGYETMRLTLATTIRVSAMILTIVLGGSMFATIFVTSGGMAMMQGFLGVDWLGAYELTALSLLLAFIGGFFLEPIAIILVLVPIVMPILEAAGVDPVWFCVLFLVTMQTSYLTPPVAPAIFYLRGIAPPEITLRDMIRGIVPFVLLQLVVLTAVALFPPLAMWLPDLLLGR